MNYLTAGWTHTFQSIRKKKLLFVLLIVLQILFGVCFLYIVLKYQLKILESAQGILQQLQNANFNADTLQAGQPFLPDSLALYKSYRSLIDDIKVMVLWLAGLFLIVNGSVWIFSHYILLGKKLSWKERLQMILSQWLKFAALTIAIYGIIVVAGYFLLKYLIVQEVDVDSFGRVFQILLYSSAIVYFFLAAGFSIISASSWREFLKHFFSVAIKKIHKALLLFVVNVLAIAATLFLIYRSMEYFENFPLALFFSVIFVIIVVIARLWWIACLQELTHETHHH